MTEPTTNWRAIETAPRDRRILLWNGVTGVYSAEWMPLPESADGVWPLLQWGGKTGRWFPEPTHWMPLPEPPKP